MDCFLLNKHAETSKTNTGSFKLLRRCWENYNSMKPVGAWTTGMCKLTGGCAKWGAVVHLVTHCTPVICWPLHFRVDRVLVKSSLFYCFWVVSDRHIQLLISYDGPWLVLPWQVPLMWFDEDFVMKRMWTYWIRKSDCSEMTEMK